MAEEVVALIPAAGHGTRLGLDRGSKEIVPVGSSPGYPEGRPIIDHLLERLGAAGIRRAVVVIRPQKDDVRRVVGRQRHGVAVEWIETAPTPSSVHTLVLALEHVPAATRWCLGYPDILFFPPGAYREVTNEALAGRHDLVLGLFPSDRPEKTDMVRLEEGGAVSELRIKQPDVGLRWTWSIACWGRRFTDLLRQSVADAAQARDSVTTASELFVGDVVRRALEEGLDVGSVRFPEGFALDVGTRDDLERARSLVGRGP